VCSCDWGEDGYGAPAADLGGFAGAEVSPARAPENRRRTSRMRWSNHPCGERRKGGFVMLIDILVVLAIIAVALYIMRGRFTRT
jgi:hypothetical protein